MKKNIILILGVFVLTFCVKESNTYYSDKPTATTDSLIELNPTDATIKITVINPKKLNINAVGLVYSNINNNPTFSDSIKNLDQSGIVNGSYTIKLTSLKSNSNYFVRAYLNFQGTSYFDTIIKFTTLNTSNLVGITTDSVNKITTNSATTYFKINNPNALNITTAGLVYSITDTSPTTSNNQINLSNTGNLSGNYSLNLTNLANGSNYYIRGYINYNGSIYYGNVKKITTLSSISINGLVSFWPFNNSLNDLSGNNNNGTISNGFQYTTDRKGNNNSAMLFLNTNTQMNTSNTFNNPQTFSVSLWIKTNQNSNLLLSSLYANSNVKDKAKKIISFQGQSNYDRSLNIYKDLIEVYIFTGSYSFVNKSINLDDLKWHHIVYSLDNSGTNIYVDGVKLVNNTIVNSAQSYSGKWVLGALTYLGGVILQNAFVGVYDDVRIYNRKLTDSEILILYNE